MVYTKTISMICISLSVTWCILKLSLWSVYLYLLHDVYLNYLYLYDLYIFIYPILSQALWAWQRKSEEANKERNNVRRFRERPWEPNQILGGLRRYRPTTSVHGKDRTVHARDNSTVSKCLMTRSQSHKKIFTSISCFICLFIFIFQHFL